MSEYKEAISKAADWMANHQKEDGSISPLEAGIGSYYKLPMAFISAGRIESAWKLLTWIRDNILDANGDFTGPYERGIYEGVYPYANAWLAVGAHVNGFFDISIPAVNFLLGIQSSEGGFLTDKALIGEVAKGSHGDGDSVYKAFNKPEITFDIMCTAMAGIACLYTGNLDSALKTASLFEKMYSEQPDLNRGFYFHYKPGEGLFKTFSEDMSAAYYLDFKKEKQFYFELGIAAVFLTKLAQFSGRDNYLKLAEDYLQLIKKAAPDKYSTPQSGKIGWAASYLFNVTEKEEYRNMAREVADYLVAAQDPSGCWYNVSKEKDLKVTTMDVTSEFIVLLHEMLPSL